VLGPSTAVTVLLDTFAQSIAKEQLMQSRMAALVALSICLTSNAHAQDGLSCASAIPVSSYSSYTSDTTNASNWMTSFGPLVSPSNDVVYKFVAGSQPLDPITPTSSNYSFAMYLIPSCSESGTEPVPISATATINQSLSLQTLTEGNTYYLAVTGTAAGGPGANGTLTFGGLFVPVVLQSFEID
jgi:hypothetical protein